MNPCVCVGPSSVSSGCQGCVHALSHSLARCLLDCFFSQWRRSHQNIYAPNSHFTIVRSLRQEDSRFATSSHLVFISITNTPAANPSIHPSHCFTLSEKQRHRNHGADLHLTEHTIQTLERIGAHSHVKGLGLDDQLETPPFISGHGRPARCTKSRWSYRQDGPGWSHCRSCYPHGWSS